MNQSTKWKDNTKSRRKKPKEWNRVISYCTWKSIAIVWIQLEQCHDNCVLVFTIIISFRYTVIATELMPSRHFSWLFFNWNSIGQTRRHFLFIFSLALHSRKFRNSTEISFHFASISSLSHLCNINFIFIFATNEWERNRTNKKLYRFVMRSVLFII